MSVCLVPAGRTTAGAAISKIILWLFVVAALVLLAQSNSRGFPWLPLVTAAAAVAAAVGGAWAPERTASVLLVFIYITPALLGFLANASIIGDVVWLAAAAGLIAASPASLRWSLPPLWRPPLVAWALVLAVTGTIVIFREVDFIAWPLGDLDITKQGPSPIVLMLWTATVGLTGVMGILWFDWMFAIFANDYDRFHRSILAPVAASWVLSSLLAVYQATVDFRFLTGFWAGFRRATGGMADANPFGVIAALWGAAIVAFYAGSTTKQLWVAVPGVLLSWCGVWVSGSRSSLAAAIVLSLVALVTVVRTLDWARPRFSPARLTLFAGALLVAGGVVFAAASRSSAVSPLTRIIAAVPGMSPQSLRNFGAELWYRGSYGSTAMQMIRDYPISGIGVGGFHTMVSDYGNTGVTMLADNAQNWFRHQLAELGLVGSAGWLAWCVLFGWLLFRTRGAGHRRAPAVIVKSILLVFALISLVGMPAQNTFVAITFWILAFWYAVLVTPPVTGNWPALSRPRIVWTAAVTVVLIAGVGSVLTAMTSLRPSLRAVQRRSEYSNGFHAEQPDADGIPYRRAHRRAVAVVNVSKPWMMLSVWVEDREIDRRPVDVSVWCNGVPVMKGRFRTAVPMTTYVQVAKDSPVLVETWASRAVDPPDREPDDRRERGLLIKWQAVDRPPPGASTR